MWGGKDMRVYTEIGEERIVMMTRMKSHKPTDGVVSSTKWTNSIRTLVTTTDLMMMMAMAGSLGIH